MSESKHDPGPWVDGKTSDSIVADGRRIGADMPSHESIDYYGGCLIAESIAPHNRTLIKAAPDLLEALEEWVTAFGPVERPNTLGADLLAKSRAAIAKAKGETA